MKRLLSLLVALSMLLVACPFAMAEETLPEGNWKIAIMTGTTDQGEEEYRAAQAMAEMYPGHILHDTYPVNFSAEVETTISKLLKFAEDPDVKAIIFVQAVQGATAAFTQIKNDMGRDDILLLAGVAAEDPADIAAASDIVFQNDEINVGNQIIDQCAEWGVDVFIHYSFARHLSYETIVARLNIFKEECEAQGIELVERDAPDPTGEIGTTGAVQYILEDIPKVMSEYAGKKVAFFCTNCGMQLGVQMAVLEQENAYYPLPCCPSPYHYYPESLGLDAGDYSDPEGFLVKIAEALDEHGAVERMSTWAVPLNQGMIKGGVEYAISYINGETEGRVDIEKMKECFYSAVGSEAEITEYVDADGKKYDNFLMILFDNINFADYLK